MLAIPTQRFGAVQRSAEDVITFPKGIHGFELQRDWLLLGDRQHGGLYWLQNVEDPNLCLSVVDPREFVSNYTLQVRRQQLDGIWNGLVLPIVVCVLTEYDGKLCLNARNPIVINPATRAGCQVDTLDERPLRYALSEQALPLKKSA